MTDIATMESIAVDLASPRSIDRAKQRRGRKNAISATVKARIDTEIQRAERRIDWLDRKASRLPLISNARRKALREAVALRLIANHLEQRKPLPKEMSHGTFGFRKADRAASVLAEIAR